MLASTIELSGLLATLLLAAQAAPSLPTSRPENEDRQELGLPERVCQLADESINEASGLIASRRFAGVYYTHNDSGGLPVIYSIGRDGRDRARITLNGAKNVDWEDIAIAPRPEPGGWDLFAADIGDNKSKRHSVQIYRFPEPDALKPAENGVPADIRVDSTTFEIMYEDGPGNAESFFVHPKTGDGYIIKKVESGPVGVYRLPAPWSADQPTVLKKIGDLKFDETPPLQRVLTAADLSPDGRYLAARSYVGGWIWSLGNADVQDSLKAALLHEPRRLELAPERQGEGMCFSADGRCLLTISEGAPTSIWESCWPRRR